MNINWSLILGCAMCSLFYPIGHCLWSWNLKNIEKRKAKMLKKAEEDKVAYESSFTKWLNDNWDKDNMLPPPLKADDAFVFLKNYLLGSDWYVNYSGSSEQIITEITYAILKKYSKRFKKECKKNDLK